MSQTKQFLVSKGTTTRDNPNRGSGDNTRLYVGRHDGHDHVSYLKFDYDWDNVGRIRSAILSLYTDDGLGDMPSTTKEHPTVTVRRVNANDTWTEGDGDGWNQDDYTFADAGTSKQQTKEMSRAEFGLTEIDITALVEEHAPGDVKRRDSTAGGKKTNQGFKLVGKTDTGKNWSGWSEDYSDSTYRPKITLTYEYAATPPDAPTNMEPSGTVAALTSFNGDFTDLDSDDRLKSSWVQVYTNGAVKNGEAGENNVITTDNTHGYTVGTEVWFHSLTGGAGLSTSRPYYVVQTSTTTTFKVSTVRGGDIVDITEAYTALTVAKPLYSANKNASAAMIQAARFEHTPDSIDLKADTNYKWRARVYDNEDSVGPWSSLVTFQFSNTAPDPPTQTPLHGASFANLDGIPFRGTFSDDDVGDVLNSYQVQLSPYDEGDARWNDDQYILWNTGRRYVASGATSFETPYGGAALDAGTYYWRARVWDNKGGFSNWAYNSIVVTDNYVPEADGTSTRIQLRPRAPWRILIKDMGANRGPGTVVAVLEDAKNVGASIVYNSPGEIHFTLPVEHPQISVIEPKQTHYAVEFRQGDGWREVFAGLMWDYDATDTDIVFYGLDYMALLDYTLDENYDPSKPDKPAEDGGSKYITTGKNSIGYIIRDQLDRATSLDNSPVGFITIGQNEATLEAMLAETLTIYSTYAPTLNFILGMMDSHRAGTGKATRLSVKKTTGGGYQFWLDDDPGTIRSNLRLRYGELVQGYRVIPFGQDWSTRVSAIGRAKDGLRVLYKTKTAYTGTAGEDYEATWGRFTRATFIDGVSDENDLTRRTASMALHGGKLGKDIALGIRSGVLQPRDGFDVCDIFPVDIVHKSIDTNNYGSGYWRAVGITWTADAQTGKQDTSLTLSPRDDNEEPETDLLTLQPISPQREWQIGWNPPTSADTALYYLDESTGIRYIRQGDGTYLREDQDPRNNNLIVNSGFEMTPIATTASFVYDTSGEWATATSTTNLATGGAALAMTTATY